MTKHDTQSPRYGVEQRISPAATIWTADGRPGLGVGLDHSDHRGVAGIESADACETSCIELRPIRFSRLGSRGNID